MSNSFFTGTDAQLYTGSQNFSDKLSAAPLDYGVSVAAAADYAAKNVTWRAAYEAAVNPETRTKAAVAEKNNQRAIIRVAASDLAKIIEGTATVTDAQKIELGLNVRKVPAPMAAPGTAYDFKVQLKGDGSIESKWKCNNPRGSQGTVYQIFRRLGLAGEFAYLGGTGDKKYHDTTIPAGTASVTYKIQAVRSTAVGDWAEFCVGFGSGSTSALTVSVVQSEPKMAA